MLSTPRMRSMTAMRQESLCKPVVGPPQIWAPSKGRIDPGPKRANPTTVMATEGMASRMACERIVRRVTSLAPMASRMSDVIDFIDANRDRFVRELIEWVKIPAISDIPEHAADVVRNAEHLVAELARWKPDQVRVLPTAGHPAVYAEWLHAPGKPTLLVYGHHDVQPVDPLDAWVSPPFDPQIREGRLYGRGTVDDKGQVFIHTKAVEAFISAAGGKLPINLKMIVEGEEEIGSFHLEDLLREHSNDARCRLCLRLRHRDVRARHAVSLRGTSWPRVLRHRGERAAYRRAFGIVRRRDRQPGQRAGEDSRPSSRRERQRSPFPGSMTVFASSPLASAQSSRGSSTTMPRGWS